MDLGLWALPQAPYRIFLQDHRPRIGYNNSLLLDLACDYRRRFDNGPNLSNP
jgi:hypothetical protein